jgi:hypothetical protein
LLDDKDSANQCARRDSQEEVLLGEGVMRILIMVSILLICCGTVFGQIEEGVTTIEGKVVKVDADKGTIVVKHKCQIIDPQATFVKEEDITYKISGDTVLVKVETTLVQDGTTVAKETPILLGGIKAANQVQVDYITRDWEIIVKKISVIK